MPYDLIKLYNYIYGDSANIEKHVKKDLPDDIKQLQIERKETEIKDYFTKVGNDFDSEDLFTKTEDDFFPKVNLRHIIRHEKNSQLEKILYGNDTDKLETKYSMPDDKAIETKLRELEQKYTLLQDKKGVLSPETITTFKMCFKLCKLIGDEFEGSNDADNNIAFLQAYKVLVLFGTDPKKCLGTLEKYLAKFDYNDPEKSPLQDALIYPLPVTQQDKIHLDDWRKLQLRYGMKIARLFKDAAAIEKHLGGRCPKDLKEAMEAPQQLRFEKKAESKISAAQPTINPQHFFKTTAQIIASSLPVGDDVKALSYAEKEKFLDQHPLAATLLERNTQNPTLLENETRNGEYFLTYEVLALLVHFKILLNPETHNTKNIFIINNDENKIKTLIQSLKLKDGEVQNSLYSKRFMQQHSICARKVK